VKIKCKPLAPTREESANFILMQFGGTVYILANVHNEVLSIGVTSDLFTRIPEHINKVYPNSFTAKYNCNKLVYYETFARIEGAMLVRNKLKKWNRKWKNKLITDFNPELKDLFAAL